MERWSKQNNACSVSFSMKDTSYDQLTHVSMEINGNIVMGSKLTDIAVSLLRQFIYNEGFTLDKKALPP